MANPFLTYTERFNPCNPFRQEVIVCDMDHTLCHANGRKVFDYEKVDTDKPDFETIVLVQAYLKYTGFKLVIVTAREDIGNCKWKTAEWLTKQDLHPIAVILKPKGDHRPSEQAKKDLIENHVIPYYNVKMIFEDSTRCAEMYRAMGFKVIMPEVTR